MREGRPSTTASIVACARGAGGVDPLAERLVPRWYAPLAHAWAPAVARLVPGVDLMRTRTLAIDEAIAASIDRGAKQVVLLGAGLCARAWRMTELADAVVYEVDHPATQTYKRSRLGGLRPRAREVRFVSVDFERDDLAESLARAGHDVSATTTWVWEGVTPYLTTEATAGTLDVVHGRSVEGSTLVLTYYTAGRKSGGARGVERRVRRWADGVFSLIGEPIRGLTSVPAMQALLAEKGFDVASDATNVELGATRGGGSPLGVAAAKLMNERIVVARRRSGA